VSGGGTLSNTTTTSATYTAPSATTSAQTVTVTATSVADATKTGSVTLTIPAKPAITPPSSAQLTGAVGAAYSLQLAGTGGIAPYTWTLTGGTLPTGWTLTTGGLLSGPAPVAGQAGAIDLTFTVTDSGTPTALTATLQLTVTIVAAPAITFTGTVPATATSGSSYTGSAAASGGAGALTYSLLSGALPAGLSLNTSTGAITGTPTGVGLSSFTVKAVDSFGDTPATQSYSITVSPGAATHFVVSAPSTATAGTAVSITVTAFDANNNIATGYSGTVHFTSTDGSATLPANAGLSSGQGSFQATLKTAGNQTITATDTVTISITGTTSSITVSSAAATHLSVSAPATATAGSPLNVSVTAEDAYNNTVTSYSGTVHLTSTDASAVLPADSALTNGAKTFSVTLKTAASQTVTATDTGSSSITGITGAIVVSPAPATRLVVTGPATATAGAALSIGVTAMDTYSNIAKAYSGTIHFTSTDGSATLPANTTLSNGQGTFPATLKTAGSGTVTATDTVTSSIAGTTSAIVVSPAAVTHLSVSAPATATAGSALNVTVTAQDAYSNTVTSYSGTVHLASTDASAVLPADSTLTNGAKIFSATLKTAASQTITATDTGASSITGTTSAIVVSPAAATSLTLTIPATTTAGVSVNIGLKAMDAYGNTATGFSGTVHFSSSDSAATLPADTTLNSGQGTFPVTMKTSNSQTITATAPSVTNGTGTILVNPGAATHLVLSAPASMQAGTQISVTVTALDGYNNTATGYSGTVHFTSTDGSATLPANSGLTSGQGSFQATLKTAGNQTVTATDTVTSSIIGGTPITVAPGPATHLAISTPATATAGTGFSLTVTGKDAYNNTDTSYQGVLLFSTSDPLLVGIVVNTPWTNGARGYTATLKTVGSQTITVTDTGNPSISGTTSAITVSPGAATNFVVWYSSSNPTAGTPYNIGITAFDQYSNTATNYTGTVHFTSTDGAAALPANTALTNGQGSFPATMKTAGTQSITATDTVNSSISGTTSAFQVGPGAAAHLVFTATPPSPVTAGPVVVTVEPTDAYGNVVTGYTGIVHITSTDPSAVLPPDSPVGAMHSFPVTLETAGSQTITATDTVTPSITATTSPITVEAGAATHLLVTAPATAATGLAFSVTVAAKDIYNNTVSNGPYPYSGTVHFTSTDGSATLPADNTLSNGQGTFQATLKTNGSQTITATDTTNSAITGTSNSITASSIIINPASATLTPAYTGSSYSQTFTASGGTGPYTWSVTVNSVAVTDLGLNLNSSTGVLSGNVPSASTPGPINFTVGVTDHNGATTSKQYTVNVDNPLMLPTAGALHAAITNADYGVNNVGINASGGSGSYSFSVNGTSIPILGQHTAIATADGLSGWNFGGSTLSLGGTPTNSETITLNVTVTDTGVTPNQSYGPIQYTILAAPQQPLALPDPSTHPLPTPVNINQSYNAGLNASGGANGASYSFSVQIGGITTAIPTDNSQVTLINGNGLTAWNSGGNSLMISGTPTTAGSITLLVTVNDSANDLAASQSYTINVINPGAGYDVSGTVNYSGSKTGWVYLQLVPNNVCNNCGGNLGTAINASSAGSLASPGMAFTIHGVPSGTYTLQAWMDNTSTDGTSGEVMGGYGGRNASNPAGVGDANIEVTSGSVPAASVTLHEAATPTLGTATPNWNPKKGFGVFLGGAFVSYDPITNSNGIEIPNSYIVQWNAGSNFSGPGGSQCFPATGNQQPWIVSGISAAGGPYYFRAAGVIGSCHSGTVGAWSAPTSSAYNIADPSSGNLVNGTVSFSQTATGPLYVGFYDLSTGNIYATMRGSKASPPTSGVSYSLQVPTGSSYFNFAVVDQKNQGLMIPGTIGNVNEQLSQTTNIVSGLNDVGNLALPSANSIATVLSQVNKNTDINGNVNTGYGLNLRVNGVYKQPASVLLQSGPSYLTPPQSDIATAEFSGNFDEWDFYPGTNGSTPGQSDVFTFNVTYTDGTSDSTLNSTPNPITASPTPLSNALSTLIYPVWNSTGVSTTPTFTWNYPSGAGNYTYQFQLQDSNNKTIWSIPSQNGKSNGFSSSISPSITWGVDPMGGTNTPSVTSLSGSSTYYWSIRATDNNGNEYTTQMAFETAQSPLTLPDNSTPGSALVNSPFSQSLNASGGSGSGYVFTVNGSAGITNGNTTTWNLGDNLTASTSTNNSNQLTVSGTPNTVATAPPITFTVSVMDSQNNTDAQGTVTYTIIVVNGLNGANNANLQGTYVCKIDGYNDSDGARWTSLSSFKANGTAATITSGIWDMNGRDQSSGEAASGTVTGTYSIGNDNNGLMTMNSVQTPGGTGSKSMQYAIALTNAVQPAQEFRMVETDDVGASPSGMHGTGNCYLAATGAFASSTLSNNNFAFGIQGEDGSGTPKANVGRFSAGAEGSTAGTGSTPGGAITSGILDGMRVGQSGDNGGTFTGSYTAPNTSTGRFTFVINPSEGGGSISFVSYIIDANRMFILETAGDSGLQVGDMRTQQQSSYSVANLNGPFVLYNQSYQYSNGSVSGYGSQVYQGTGNGVGGMTMNQSYEDYEGTYSAGQENGTGTVTFDSNNPGRATALSDSDSIFLYFFNDNSAFELDLGSSGYLDSGWMEPQSQTAFTNAALAGTYMMGEMPRLQAVDRGSVGEMTISSNGSASGAFTDAGQGKFDWDQSMSTTYGWDPTANGTGTFLFASPASMSCAVISSTKIACTVQNDSNPGVTILQQ
jgi:hypothetical protein